MVFKPGSNVEVWTRREVPSGSWRIAEIVSGNGITFRVRFCGYPKGSRVTVDRVPLKAIRPFPPDVGGIDRLIAGDVVEVLHKDSWKLAEVSRLDGLFCYARLLGTSRELQVPRADIRLRLAWHDGKWTLILNESGRPNTRTMRSTAWSGLKRRAPGAPAMDMHDERRRKTMGQIPAALRRPPSSTQMQPAARNALRAEAADSDSESASSSVGSCSVGAP